jgi:hypothetical protein
VITSRTVKLAAALAAAATMATTATSAQAATVTARGAAISSPTAGKLLTRGRLTVRLRTGSKVTRIRAFDGATEVTNHFRRSGRTWSATLPRSVLRSGTNRLVVQAFAGKRAGGTDAVSFIVARSAPRLMKVSTGAPAQAASAVAGTPTPDPAAALATAAVPVTITSKTPTIARLTVNGHRVRDLHARQATRRHTWIVSAGDGLHVGANAFSVESYGRDGRHATKRWTVRRGAALPLADAGPSERTVTAGKTLRLDASASRATRRGAKLRYRWRIVSAPKGAKPVLRNATAVKPTFKPDVPGVYRLALSATHVTPGKASAASVGSAAQDIVTVDAAPAFGSQGLYVDTGLFGSAALGGRNHVPYDTLYIGDQPYRTFTDSAPDEFVQLDEQTLAVVASGTHADVAPADGVITIGVWQGTTVPYTSDEYGSAVWIGTNRVALNSTSAAPDADAGNWNSVLHGWLQPATGSSDKATWVDSDMLTLDTHAAGSSATSNTINVGGATYTGALPDGATGGFQLLVLGNMALLAADPVLYPLTGDADQDQAYEDLLAAKINAAAVGDVTIVVQGIGAVPSIPAGSKLSNALVGIGANANVLSRLNSTSDAQGAAYSLVAGAHTASNLHAWQARETSFERTQTGGSFTGLVVRDEHSDNYVPLIGDSAKADAAGASRYQSLPDLYSAPTAWTDSVRAGSGLREATAGEQAAMRYVSSYVAGQNGWTVDECHDPRADAVRQYYCHLGDSDLTQLSSHIAGISYSATDAAANGYTATDFSTAQSTYESEIADVESIHDGIAGYQSIFGADKIDAVVDGNQIAQTIQTQLYSASQTVTDNTYDVMEGALTVLSGVPDVGSAAAYMAGLFAVGSALLPDANDTPDLPNAVEFSQANAGTTIASYYKGASSQLGTFADDMVQDPAKLQTMAAAFRAGPLSLTSSVETHLENMAEYGTKQFLWGTLLGTTYAEWTAPTTTLSRNPSCFLSSKNYTPFSNVGDSGYWEWQAPNQPTGTDRWWMAVNRGSKPSISVIGTNAGLPATITDPLFKPVDATQSSDKSPNVGAVMPYFALNYLPFKVVPVVYDPEKENYGCVPGD